MRNKFRIVLICITAILYLNSFQLKAQHTAISDVSHLADTTSVLDVFSTKKGMLIPRITLTSTSDSTTIVKAANSLLIYNTATISDVSPGFYYWKGSSKWVRLIASSDILPASSMYMVNKTASCTLLKSENMVFASGDITLTLPAITSADDGLTITCKSNGTYMDKVSVIGSGSTTIDGKSSSTLYKGWGRTYIARGGNWYRKENINRLENVYEVSDRSSWETITQIIEFLGSHMTGPSVINLGAGTFTISATQTINLPYPLAIISTSYGETSINATSALAGNPMFVCQTECHFKMLIFNAYSNTTGNDAIRFTGSGKYHEVKDNEFNGFNKALISTTSNELYVFENYFRSCAGAGIEIAAGSASGGQLIVSECDFIHCAKGVNLLSGVGEDVTIRGTSYYNTISGSDIGINYDPAGFTSVATMHITNNAWNNEGTYISGFDFTRPDGRDANIMVDNNAGIENKNPFCKINVNNNINATTIVNAGTYYKAVWTNTSSHTCKFTIADNKITYQPVNKKGAWAVISGNISVSNNNRTITVCFVKNGVTTTRYGETDFRISAANQSTQFSTVIYIDELAKNDYLELYVTSSSSSDIITFQDIQWYTETR